MVWVCILFFILVEISEGNMKRIEIKLLIIGLVLVMLGACSQPETLPGTGDDDQRDIIAYVKSTDEMDLKSLLEA